MPKDKVPKKDADDKFKTYLANAAVASSMGSPGIGFLFPTLTNITDDTIEDKDTAENSEENLKK